jgi:hypothetical protein
VDTIFGEAWAVVETVRFVCPEHRSAPLADIVTDEMWQSIRNFLGGLGAAADTPLQMEVYFDGIGANS